MNAPFIDFAAIKSEVSLHQGMQMLGLELKQHGGQFRGCCPVHGGNDRSLVVTPMKGFYCFPSKLGGDVIQLVAHVKQIGNKEAAEEIQKYFGRAMPRADRETSRTSAPSQQQKTGLAAVADYLQPEHEGVQARGISVETAKTFGAGYAPKGILRGRLAVPIKALDGTLLAYCGIALNNEQPYLAFPRDFKPDTVIFNADRIERGDFVYVTRDPLQVLLSAENGSTNVVAFLGDITADALQVLSLFMDEKDIPSIDIL